MKAVSSQQFLVPDLLRPALTLVLCGTAPGRVSAAQKQYYAHPHNKFWPVLYATGLTSRLLTPAEYPLLPDWGIGLTDIAKHVSGQDNQLPKGSFGQEMIAALKGRILKCQPKILAFTSLTGGRHFLRRKAAFGPQPETIGDTRIWILPSSSPKAQWNWDETIWHALADEVRALRNEGSCAQAS
jgi:TDG/mug DNA glycosylase family protein